MSKEIYYQQSTEIQNQLWGRMSRKEGLEKKTDQIKKGYIPNSLSCNDLNGNLDVFTRILGEFAPRVIAISNPGNLKSLVPEQIAIAGGWCALRTSDVTNLGERGVIVCPDSGRIEEVKSVSQVADWIKNAVAFDQIIESVGAVLAPEYAVISERKLWSERICTKLETILEKKLNSEEKALIENAVEEAEKIRSVITSRYITYVTGETEINFQRVVDEDIWEDLIQARDQMLELGGIPIDRLKNSYPNDKSIETASLVWAMYSEPYFDVLRKKGYLRSKKVIIVEPSKHACVESLPEISLVQRIYQDKGVYFNQRGFNKNTGFIAFLECMTSDGKNTRISKSLGEVPNIRNWESLFGTNMVFDPEKNKSLNPTENQLFVWGANLLPFGRTRIALLTLAFLSDAFKEEKEKIVSQFRTGTNKMNPGERFTAKFAVEALKIEYAKMVGEENLIISEELKKLFKFLTDKL